MFSREILKKSVGHEISISQFMVRKIEEWDLMLKGEAEWCTDDIKSLKLESEICKEFANVTLSEMEVKIDNEKLDKVFNDSIKGLNEAFQNALGLGSFVIKPLGENKVEYINADNIIPIEFSASGRLIKCAFIQTKIIGEDYYYRIESHFLNKGGLTITNKAFKGKKGQLGGETLLNNIEEWANLPKEITYPKMDRVAFGYYRNPIPNRIDKSFNGVSIFENAIEHIKKADIQNARLDYEYDSAERAVFADWTTVRKDKDNKLSLPTRRKKLFIGVEKEDAIDTFNPEIRDSNFIQGLNEYLRRVEFNCSLAYGDLSKNEVVDKTATEIKASKKRKYDMVNAIQNNLKDCLEDLCYALAFYNGLYTSNFNFTCNFKDSILTDEEVERAQDRQDVAMGVMSLVEYRMKWYGEDEATAAKKIPEPVNEVLE
ncbi:phage capsid protein [Erysipelotrichaceae bacterium OH741_COT-311]|nr:phage capsid protein [Erysipelotrichaceae bacterium OH741_COT-311]